MNELEAEKQRHLLVLIAITEAAGGRIEVQPQHLVNVLKRRLVREENPQTGGFVFRTIPA